MTAKIMTTMPATITAAGSSNAPRATIIAAAVTAATELIASERTGGGGANVNRAS
jgi:hypothetical protein